MCDFYYCRSRLAKTKIDAGTENEKKDDSGNETGAGEGEQEEESDIVHYDKSKSFFDNISCEAVERSKGSVFIQEYLTCSCVLFGYLFFFTFFFLFYVVLLVVCRVDLLGPESIDSMLSHFH